MYKVSPDNLESTSLHICSWLFCYFSQEISLHIHYSSCYSYTSHSSTLLLVSVQKVEMKFNFIYHMSWCSYHIIASFPFFLSRWSISRYSFCPWVCEFLCGSVFLSTGVTPLLFLLDILICRWYILTVTLVGPKLGDICALPVTACFKIQWLGWLATCSGQKWSLSLFFPAIYPWEQWRTFCPLNPFPFTCGPHLMFLL